MEKQWAVTHHVEHQRVSCTHGPSHGPSVPVTGIDSSCRILSHGRGRQKSGYEGCGEEKA